MSAPPFDLAAARDNSGDDEVLRELAELFVEECPKMLECIREALAAGDARALKMSAHAIKGALRVFAAGQAEEAAFQLERNAEADTLVGAQAGLERLEHALTQLLPALREVSRSAAP